MNNEIKEMLEQMESIAITGKDKNGIKVDGYGLQQNGLKILLDYITNLQQQLHQASLDIQELTEKDIECPSWCDKLTNLQQEIKEANESITWWTNRFKAVERDNRELKEEIEEEKRIEEADLKTIQRLEKENERIEKEYKSKVDDIGKLTSRIYQAIEYIENPRHEMSVLTYQNLLNILQNGSEEDE